jgi:benzoylformate decarboxylase
MMSGADTHTPVGALLEILRDEGVTRVFGNPGTTELPFLDALVGTPRLDFILGLQEASVVAMADGYARATRRPAFVSLHVAAGLANGLIGLLNARRSRTPLVVTAGQQDRRHLIQDPMLSGDLVALAAPAVKHACQVERAQDLAPLLRRAFALAVQPPAGPVFLSVPMDLLTEDTTVTVPRRSPPPTLGPASEVAAAVTLLTAAEYPVVVAGDGVGRGGAVGELIRVAEALGAPVLHQPMYDTLDFPCSHPLYAGVLPPENRAIHDRLAKHDLLLLVGCHAFTPHHYTPGPAVPASLTVVQVDCDAAEFGRNFPTDLGLLGDIAATLSGLADGLTARIPQASNHTKPARGPAGPAARRRGDAPGARAPLAPDTAVHALIDGLPDDAVVVEEAITTGVLLREAFRPSLPGSYVHTVGGGLGWGVGSAIGTVMGDGSRPVVAVLGDGCTVFGLQGLWSAVRYEVPVTFVVINNGEYRTLKQTLDSWQSRATRAGHYPGLDLAPPRLDFTRAAGFFGMDAVRVHSAAELTDSVARAARSRRPLLIDVPVTGHTAAHGEART